MSLPRDIDFSELIKNLKKLGYETARQKGSYIRLITELNGKHAITVPAHDPIKVGTLNAIISDIAEHFKISKNELIKKLFN
ncbi:MAG TPA: hypothetical protein DCP90_00440 [Clostridiales bacterium]|nr:MAG: hypothetical protein A2Y22_08155 [Clostridiales bacterium GWD2_32_59]HAN09064.1 hypothetical protein [Clostridiales bacterium]